MDPQNFRDDLIYYSTVPWISFSSVSHPRKLNQEESIPKLVFGKYNEALCYIFKILRNKDAMSDQPIAQIDTAPISVCQAQHSANAKAATPFVTKGYCQAKNVLYWYQITNYFTESISSITLSY